MKIIRSYFKLFVFFGFFIFHKHCHADANILVISSKYHLGLSVFEMLETGKLIENNPYKAKQNRFYSKDFTLESAFIRLNMTLCSSEFILYPMSRSYFPQYSGFVLIYEAGDLQSFKEAITQKTTILQYYSENGYTHPPAFMFLAIQNSDIKHHLHTNSNDLAFLVNANNGQNIQRSFYIFADQLTKKL